MKRSKKKLHVDKETVRPLTPDEAQQAEGGYYIMRPTPTTPFSCPETCTEGGNGR